MYSRLWEPDMPLTLREATAGSSQSSSGSPPRVPGLLRFFTRPPSGRFNTRTWRRSDARASAKFDRPTSNRIQESPAKHDRRDTYRRQNRGPLTASSPSTSTLQSISALGRIDDMMSPHERMDLRPLNLSVTTQWPCFSDPLLTPNWGSTDTDPLLHLRTIDNTGLGNNADGNFFSTLAGYQQTANVGPFSGISHLIESDWNYETDLKQNLQVGQPAIDFTNQSSGSTGQKWKQGVLTNDATLSNTETGPALQWALPVDLGTCVPIPYYPTDSPEDVVNSAVSVLQAPTAPFFTPFGTISLQLSGRIQVDLTTDKAVRIINVKNNAVLCLSSNGSATALLHPNGRVFQHGSRVEILTYDTAGNHKLAKMWYRGVSFTAVKCPLVYLVDSAGTRTTTDMFSDMGHDFFSPVFYKNMPYDASTIHEAMSIISRSEYFVTEDKVRRWVINGIRISQTEDGLVRVRRCGHKYLLRTSPSNGSAVMSTPFIHCTASMGQTAHMFVRRGERRLHYDGSSFIVRNAGHSAGFDEKNRLKVF